MKLRRTTNSSQGSDVGPAHLPVWIHWPAAIHAPHRDHGDSTGADRDAALRTDLILKRLPERDFCVLDGVDRRHGTDHVVVGPGGIFAITSRKPAGPGVRVRDGVLWLRKGEDVRATRPGTAINRCALDAARALEREIRARTAHRLEIQPVVVLWCEFPQAVAESARIAFVHGRDLPSWLATRPRQLDRSSCLEIALAIRGQSSLWAGNAHLWGPAA